jgi:hypothetical protein
LFGLKADHYGDADDCQSQVRLLLDDDAAFLLSQKLALITHLHSPTRQMKNDGNEGKECVGAVFWAHVSLCNNYTSNTAHIVNILRYLRGYEKMTNGVPMQRTWTNITRKRLLSIVYFDA